MILSITVLAALATLSGLTVITTRGTMSQETNDRFHTIAIRAAESGAASAMDYLRANMNHAPGPHWTYFLTNPLAFPANGALPGTPDNQFRIDQQAYYTVTVVNNKPDPGYGVGTDADGDVIIRSTGHGPNGAVSVIEWEVHEGTNSLAPMTLVAWHEAL